MQITTCASEETDAVGDSVTDICKEEAYLRELATFITNGVASHEATVEKSAQRKERWQLVADATTDVERRCLLKTLGGYAHKQIETARPNIKGARTAIAQAAQAINRKIGKLQATRLLAKTALKEKANSHTTTSTTQLNMALQSDLSGTDYCTDIKTAKDIKADNTAPTFAKLHQLKLTKDDDPHKAISDFTVKLKGIVGCTSDTGPAAAKSMGNCAMGGTDEPIVVVTNAKAPKIRPSTISVFKAPADRTACMTVVTNANTNANTQELLAYHVCKALQARQFTTTDVENMDGNKLAATKSVVSAVRNCQPKYQQIADPTTGDDSSNIKEFIKNAYDSNDKDFVAGFITNTDDVQVPVRSAGKKSEQEIKTIATPEARLAALSHLEVERNAREVVERTAGAGAALP
uniref:Variant surface glycoprotein 1125.5010 n=1 Tax=Trypanosoma brucei TaxID=5691 RepID=A0A1J0RBF5_9TRYP|nr:variant surface glycoprotein 1125.5010 [Trypanosoma brucei]